MKYYLSEKNPHVHSNLIRDLSQINPSKDWVVTIKQGKDSKTEQQRNYFHKLLELISKESGDTIEDLKTRACFALGYVRLITLKDGRVIEERESTEKMNKEKYSNLINAAQTMCGFLEINYPQPKYYGMEI